MICKKCRNAVRVASKFLDEKLTDALDFAADVTAELKKFIGNPLFELLVSQIPPIAGVSPEDVLNVIQSELEKISQLAGCKDLTGLQRINCMMNALNLLPKSEQNKFFSSVSSSLALIADGGRYKNFVYDTATQMHYFNYKLKEGANVLRGTETPKEKEPENVVQISESVKDKFSFATPTDEPILAGQKKDAF